MQKKRFSHDTAHIILAYFRTIVSKPREFAHLIKNKFGSADNINTFSKYNNTEENIRCVCDGS